MAQQWPIGRFGKYVPPYLGPEKELPSVGAFQAQHLQPGDFDTSTIPSMTRGAALLNRLWPTQDQQGWLYTKPSEPGFSPTGPRGTIQNATRSPLTQALREGYTKAQQNPYKPGYSINQIPGFGEVYSPYTTPKGSGYTPSDVTSGPKISTKVDLGDFFGGQKQVTPNLPPGFNIKVSSDPAWTYIRGYVPGNTRDIAELTVNNATRRVGSANTDPNYQKRGVGSALYAHAQTLFPGLQHSRNLSPAGQAFAASTEGWNQGNVVPTVNLQDNQVHDWLQKGFVGALNHLYSGQQLWGGVAHFQTPEEAYQHALDRYQQLKPRSNPFWRGPNPAATLPNWMIPTTQGPPWYSEVGPAPRPERGLAPTYPARPLQEALTRALNQRTGTPEIQQFLTSLPRSQIHQIHDAYLRGDINRDEWAAQMRRLGLTPPSA